MKRKVKKWTAYDVPYLRDDLIRSTRFAVDTMVYTKSILDDVNAVEEANTTAYHIDSVELQNKSLQRDDMNMHYVSRSMCQMITEMSGSLPEWTVSQALPSDYGFLIFERSVCDLMYVTDKDKEPVPLRGIFWHLRGDSVEIVTLTDSSSQLVVDNADGDSIFKIGLIYFHKSQIQGAGRVSTGVSGSDHIVNFTNFDRNRQFDKIISIVGATWLLMSQDSVIEDVETPVKMKQRSESPSGSRRKTVKDVIVHEQSLIKRSASSRYMRDKDNKQTGREYSKQWWVSGHWRQQACGPKWSERKPVFIEPHIAGPEDKPLDEREEVTRWKK